MKITLNRQIPGWHCLRHMPFQFLDYGLKLQWCRERFERSEWVLFDDGECWFLHERDAVIFALRWL
jgi:hypothetical protein